VDHSNFMAKGLIEIKGWWDDKSKRKLKLLKEQRPAVFARLTIIDSSTMKTLIQKYASTVPNWESKK
jgi:hypothetical protein